MGVSPSDSLRTASSAIEAVLAGIGDDQWSSVGDSEGAGADRLTAYRRSAGRLFEAFAAEGALERVVTVPFGRGTGAVALHLRTTELLVHGWWDLARATDELIEVPDALARAEHVFSR